MIKDLIEKNRSYRRFYQNEAISLEILEELVDLARITASAANLQPLKYITSCLPEKNAEIFKTLGWAGYLKDWDGPAEGERPAGYIIILKDREINKAATVDEGIAAQSILLGAVEKGLGGCMLGSVKRDELKKLFGLKDSLDIVLVVALGKPKEQVVLEAVRQDGDIRYYRDAQQVHHVPKRRLEDIILRQY